MTLPTEEFDSETPAAELVHWMEPGPLRLGSAGVSTAAAGAFVLGVVAAFGALAAYRYRGARACRPGAGGGALCTRP